MHTKNGRHALEVVHSKDWSLTKQIDRTRLEELTDDLLEGHRQGGVQYTTRVPHDSSDVIELTFDPTEWAVVGGGIVGENGLMPNMGESE